MTITRIPSAALFAVASFGAISASNAVVPGSDTYELAATARPSSP